MSAAPVPSLAPVAMTARSSLPPLGRRSSLPPLERQSILPAFGRHSIVPAFGRQSILPPLEHHSILPPLGRHSVVPALGRNSIVPLAARRSIPPLGRREYDGLRGSLATLGIGRLQPLPLDVRRAALAAMLAVSVATNGDVGERLRALDRTGQFSVHRIDELKAAAAATLYAASQMAAAATVTEGSRWAEELQRVWTLLVWAYGDVRVAAARVGAYEIRPLPGVVEGLMAFEPTSLRCDEPEPAPPPISSVMPTFRNTRRPA